MYVVSEAISCQWAIILDHKGLHLKTEDRRESPYVYEDDSSWTGWDSRYTSQSINAGGCRRLASSGRLLTGNRLDLSAIRDVFLVSQVCGGNSKKDWTKRWERPISNPALIFQENQVPTFSPRLSNCQPHTHRNEASTEGGQFLIAGRTHFTAYNLVPLMCVSSISMAYSYSQPANTENKIKEKAGSRSRGLRDKEVTKYSTYKEPRTMIVLSRFHSGLLISTYLKDLMSLLAHYISDITSFIPGAIYPVNSK